MTVEEAQGIIDKTTSPYLKRDMEKFIKRQRRKEGSYGTTQKGNRPEAVRGAVRASMYPSGNLRRVSDKTLDGWCKRTYGEHFSEVFAKKRGKGKISLRRMQWRLAEKNASMAIWLGKQYLDQKDVVEQNINTECVKVIIDV